MFLGMFIGMSCMYGLVDGKQSLLIYGGMRRHSEFSYQLVYQEYYTRENITTIVVQ